MTDHHDFGFHDDHHDPEPFPVDQPDQVDHGDDPWGGDWHGDPHESWSHEEQPDQPWSPDATHGDGHHGDDGDPHPAHGDGHHGDQPTPHPDEQDGTAGAESPVHADPLAVFPPTLDVGPLPEPVDGFPWIDVHSLGDAGPVGPYEPHEPVAAQDLAGYAGVELPADADPWQALVASDDPATEALARWWQQQA